MPKYTSVEAVEVRIGYLKSEIERLEDVKEELANEAKLVNKHMVLTAANLIMDGFYWADTPEGHEYWQEVHSKLEELAAASGNNQFRTGDFSQSYDTADLKRILK